MRLFQVTRKSSLFANHEAGVSLIETLVALAILGVVAITFLNGLATISKAAFTDDEQTTAESLARSQMEWVKNIEYIYGTTEYSPAPMPNGGDYVNYSAVIVAEPLHDPDDGLQKIRVTIQHSDKGLIQLDGYKVDR